MTTKNKLKSSKKTSPTHTKSGSDKSKKKGVGVVYKQGECTIESYYYDDTEGNYLKKINIDDDALDRDEADYRR